MLDVGIVVFDPGVPAGEIDIELLEELIEQGTFVQIRRSESLFFSVQLRDTLRRSDQWGSVWITPAGDPRIRRERRCGNSALRRRDGSR